MPQKVLIVDDVPAVYEGLRRAFHHEPYELLYAENAEEGFQLLRRTVIAVVIADQAMPGLTGVEFLKQVREHCPATTRMMLTGKATLEVALAAINEGAVERFFMKPSQPIEIALAIRQALKQRELLIRVHRLMRRQETEKTQSGNTPPPHKVEVFEQRAEDPNVTLEQVLEELRAVGEDAD